MKKESFSKIDGALSARALMRAKPARGAFTRLHMNAPWREGRVNAAPRSGA